MIYYKLVKTIINLAGLAKVIINIVVRHYNYLDSIISNKAFFLFTPKFYSLLYYFFNIK